MNQHSALHSFWCRYLFIIFLLISSSSLWAQSTVTGRVVDSTAGQGISKVSVVVEGTRRGTVTDANGNFRINASTGEVLLISFLGYRTERVPVSGGPVSVALASQESQLTDVVVIGYGTRQRKDVTGAVSTVSSKDIEKSTSMTPELALQGRAAGVFVNAGGGDPQARPTIRIRSVNTFGFAEPLYVIDGVPIFEGGAGVNDGAIGDIRSPINIYSMINPNDIESISVLKDASAAAIYGVRASNGVILITTKKGKSGRPKVEVSSSYGVQNIRKTYDVLNTQQYFDLVREAYSANPDANTSFEQKFGPRYTPSNALYAGNNPTYNWQGELLNKNASLQDHSVKLSGGSDATTYYLSVGLARQESPLQGNNLERYSVATNIDSRISKILSTGFSLRLVQERALVNTQSDLPTMASTIPFQPIYDPNDPTRLRGSRRRQLCTQPFL